MTIIDPKVFEDERIVAVENAPGGGMRIYLTASGGGGKGGEAPDVDFDEMEQNLKDIEANQEFIIGTIDKEKQRRLREKEKERLRKRPPSIDTPNNLTSVSYLEVLFLISEGQIAGFPTTDFYKHIYLDETPIQNADGGFNFDNVIVDFRPGSSAQTHIPDIAGTLDAEVDVGVRLTYQNPVVRTIHDREIDSVRVRLTVPSLLEYINDPGVAKQRNVAVGSVLGSSVSFAIHWKSATHASWTEAYGYTLNGKTESPYEIQFLFGVYGGAPYDIRVTKQSYDSTNSLLQEGLIWSSYTKSIAHWYSHPYTAIVGVKIQADQFNHIPSVAFDMKGVFVKVPHNYNPTTRKYNGDFAGILLDSWTDNPAWILYDILSNARYGCGEFINTSMLDVYSFYSMGKYCDELVPTNRPWIKNDPATGIPDGYEPRFTCNAYIQSRDDAIKLLDTLSSVCRGMLFYNGNTIFVTQDRPTKTTRLYSPVNVIQEFDDQGKVTRPPFVYQSSSLESRHTVAMVTWSDPKDFYRSRLEYVNQPEMLAKYGYNPVEVVGFGITSRSQAWRLGKWILETEKELTETVTFRVASEGMLVLPGEVFAISDPTRTVDKLSGRIKSYVGSFPPTVTLDRPVTLVAGLTYIMHVLTLTGEVQSHYVVNIPGTVTTVTFATDLENHIPDNSIWILEHNNIKPQLFRCFTVAEQEENQYEITGVEYNESIYNVVDRGTKIIDRKISGLPKMNIPPDPPSGIIVREELYAPPGSAGVKTRAYLSWTASKTPMIREYILEHKLYWETTFKTIQVGLALNATIDDVTPGVNVFRIKSKNPLGLESAYLYAIKPIAGLTAPPTDIVNFQVQAQGGLAFATWEQHPDIDVRIGGFFKIKHTTKQVNAKWSDGIELATISGGTNTAMLSLIDGTYMIKAVDSSGIQSVGYDVAILSNVRDVLETNFYDDLIMHPDFDMSVLSQNVIVSGGILKLTSLDYFDQTTGMFDAQTGLFDYVEGYFDSFSGNFEDIEGNFDDAGATFTFPDEGLFIPFPQTIDVGEPCISTISMEFSALSVDEYNLFEKTSGMFDDRIGMFDGVGLDQSYAVVEVCASNDVLAYQFDSNYKPLIPGNYDKQYYDFRIKLYSGEPHHNIWIDKCRIIVDMPERRESGTVTTQVMSSTYVPFTYHYRQLPKVGVTVLNGQSGDYIVVSDETLNGFRVAVKDSSNANVVRDISWISVGIGRAVINA